MIEKCVKSKKVLNQSSILFDISCKVRDDEVGRLREILRTLGVRLERLGAGIIGIIYGWVDF